MNSEKEIENLEKIIGQLNGLHSEISLLAKKSPNDALNKFKLGLINRVIDSANSVLGDKYSPFDDFEGFDTDDLPSNSDVALVLAQYIEEAERYRSDNVMAYGGSWFYILKGGKSEIRSGAPTKVGRK